MFYDVVILGAGPSGVMAAITAKRLNAKLKIALIEKNARIGKKLLSTGNGRCNLTNINQDSTHYHSKNKWFTQQILQQFDLNETLAFFRSIGIETITEGEKVFPHSLQANSVLDLLRYALQHDNIESICDFDCTSIRKDADLFSLRSSDDRTVKTRKIVVATGGNAAPQLGSSGDGYRFLKEFGHKVTTLYPSLVQVCTAGKKTIPLKGIKVNASVNVFDKDSLLSTEYGEVLFTEYGLSGPPIFQLSRYASLVKEPVFKLDLFPQLSCDELVALLEERAALLPKELLLTGLLHNTVCRELLRELGENASSIQQLAELLKSWAFKVVSTRGWNSAQVTGGGVDLGDFSPLSLESKLVKNLYACGEVLDVCGDCGGYNLQWAWSSGAVVGRAIAKE